MEKRLTYRNGYRFGHLPISYAMAQIILRMLTRESIERQCRAFNLLFENSTR